jgi:hypothetical protein
VNITDLFQSNAGYNHFDDVAEGSIEQTTDTLAGSDSNLFGAQPKQRCERDDGKAGKYEDQRGALVRVMEYPGNRYEHKTYVQWRVLERCYE